MIKTVLIDIDNTLIDFYKSSDVCIKQAFNEFGIEYNNTTFDCFKRINDDLWLKIERGELDRQGLHKIRFNLVLDALGQSGDGQGLETRFRQLLFDTAIPVEGALESLEYLAGKYKVYASSNAIYMQQINRLKKCKMLEFFSGLFISEKLGVSKPTKEFFDACMLGANAEKESTVMIGDSLSADIIGAKNYGLKTIWYRHNKDNPLEDVNADLVINSMKEILTCL